MNRGIRVEMKSGEVHDFPEERRPGGSYSLRMTFETGFVVITDVWGKQTCFPSEDVKKIERNDT